MVKRPPNLPEYDRPPVIEVVLGVQFSILERFHTVHLGKLWDVFRDAFPNFSENPPLAPDFETFGKKPPELSQKLQLLTNLPMPRLWFINQNDTELIQFQQDRFLHNWRKVGDGEIYPRYEPIKKRFLVELEQLTGFLRSENLGEITPNQCEITYVNHIQPAKDENLQASFGEVFSIWNDLRGTAGFDVYETARLGIDSVISSEDGEPIGRLHVKAEPRRLRDGGSGTPIIYLELTARGKPMNDSLKGVSAFLDLGRQKIVESFSALTTSRMHERWKRKK